MSYIVDCAIELVVEIEGARPHEVSEALRDLELLAEEGRDAAKPLYRAMAEFLKQVKQ